MFSYLKSKIKIQKRKTNSVETQILLRSLLYFSNIHSRVKEKQKEKVKKKKKAHEGIKELP